MISCCTVQFQITTEGDEIDFYLEMNCNFGQHFLSQQHLLSPSIWSLLLSKFNDNLSVVFVYVREVPMLVAGGRKRRR
jgi:hypothetical protein